MLPVSSELDLLNQLKPGKSKSNSEGRRGISSQWVPVRSTSQGPVAA